MTTYELYINDILCDLSSDEVVTLLYQLWFDVEFR